MIGPFSFFRLPVRTTLDIVSKYVLLPLGLLAFMLLIGLMCSPAYWR